MVIYFSFPNDVCSAYLILQFHLYLTLEMHTTRNPSEAFAKKIFFVCLVAFALLQLYGIYYDQLRLQFEASSDKVWFSGPGYHTPMYRYAFILNKFLLFPAFWLHLPMKVVAVIYCINDAIFYLLIAFLIIALTQRYDYAASVLAAPLLIHGSNFYWIVNEIFLSGSLLILYTGIVKYRDDSIFKSALLPVCMFFIIWSHPVMVLVLIVFLPFIYPSLAEIKKAMPMLIFILVNVICRLALLSGYDLDQMNRMDGRSLDPKYWLGLTWDFLFEYSAMAIVMAVALYFIARSKSKAQYCGILVTPLLLICCNRYHLDAGNLYLAKILYPITLFLLLQSIIFICTLYAANGMFVSAAMAVLLFWGFSHTLCKDHQRLSHRVEVIKKLNVLCKQEAPGHSKWFVRSESLDSIADISRDWHTESLFFSAYEGQSPTIELVRAGGSDIAVLCSFPAEKVFLNKDAFLPVKSLNRNYFHINTGPYMELVLDPAKMKYLKEQ